MELMPSNRRRPDAGATADETAQAEWATAIRERYGAIESFARTFGPDNRVQKYCAEQTARAVAEKMPSFVRILRTYGEEPITQLLAAHLTDAVLRLGEDRDVDTADIRFTAEAMTAGPTGRKLTWASIVGFFFRLKCGEFEIYGKVTPRKILEAFRRYAGEQLAREHRLAYEQEQRERTEREKREEADPKGRTAYAELLRQRGLPDDTSVSDFLFLLMQERASG
jgi:hypothetical protein